MLNLYQYLTTESVETLATIKWYSYIFIMLAFIVGFFAIKFMLKFITKAGFK